jgi:hypothetical protein
MSLFLLLDCIILFFSLVILFTCIKSLVENKRVKKTPLNSTIKQTLNY